MSAAASWRGRAVIAAALISFPAAAKAAEWQLKPFLGLTFGGDTSLLLVETRTKLSVGLSSVVLGDLLGVEGEVEHVPGLFQDLATDVTSIVAASSATVVTGNLVLALPRRLTEYTLRPYVLGGGGRLHASVDPLVGGIPVSTWLSAIDFGGGATGFLTPRVGLSWEVRWFRTVSGNNVGLSIGREEVSFWRANMAVAIRLTRSTQ
jgi:hypothetical protein